MEANNWIIYQVIIDIIMAVLLLWFIIFQYRRKRPHQDFETAFRKSEAILSEMRQISQVFDKNLKEKRELSHHILGQLDEGLKRAEESYQQIQKIIQKYSTNLTYQPSTLNDVNHTRSSIDALLAKGLSRKKIAQHLGISVGEIELLLKLQPQERNRKKG